MPGKCLTSCIKKRKMKKVINPILFRSISLIFICSLLFACEAPQKNEVADMFKKVSMDKRFVTSDWLAKKIIDDDPSIQVIDVRSLYEFEEYAIPSSINIPLETILNDDVAPLFKDQNLKTVLYSNGDIYADQAWVLLNMGNNSNLFILKGGLNEWFRTIMLPQPPQIDATESEFNTYSFRKGASLYFGGSVQEVPVAVELDMESKPVQQVAPKKKVEVKKKEKKPAEGGC
jgi:rhodanese-related sulfurtransferase